MNLICGIDEAGRGPVIGPLVIAGVLVAEKDIPKLKKMGVTDSKLLTRKKREYLFKKIMGIVKMYKIVVIGPKEIDDALNSDELNLNWLEANKSADIINELNPKKATIDSPSNNIPAYRSYILKQLKNKELELECMHKADLKRVYVGAASILAKVTRDNEIDKIKKKIGIDLGSGYPSDEITQKFLKENWNKYPEIFRKTWSSYSSVSKAKNQKKLADF